MRSFHERIPFTKIDAQKNDRKEFLLFSVLAVGSLVGITGLLRELSSQAATPVVGSEPEAGTLTAGAGVVNDTAASAGKAVAFAQTVTPPPPPPATGKVFYGACPHNNANRASVITKFGNRASIRAFASTLTSAADRPAAASVVHWSWKQPAGSTITRQMLVTTFANLKDGDVVEVQHEHDNDANITQLAALKTQFHRAVVAAREAGDIRQVLTCNTYTGYAFATENSKSPDAGYAEADLLGSDWDGIDPISTKKFSGAGFPASSPVYYDFFAHEYAETVAFKNRMGYKGWCIPEFGSFRDTVNDPTGSVRVAWMQDQVRKLDTAADKPYYCALFDYSNRPSVSSHLECLELPNEINAWKAFVASNPAA